MKLGCFIVSLVAAKSIEPANDEPEVTSVDVKSSRSGESNGGSPGGNSGGGGNNGGGGCIGDGCNGGGSYPTPPTTTTTTTTKKPSGGCVPEIMANSLQWCGYLGLSDANCARRLSDDTEYYCGGYYTCAMTSTLPAAAWQTHYYHDKYYDMFAICGPRSTTYPNSSKLQAGCDAASNYCGADMSCIRDFMKESHYAGIHNFCPGNSFNLLVNPSSGSCGWGGYNGAIHQSRHSWCTAYCI